MELTDRERLQPWNGKTTNSISRHVGSSFLFISENCMCNWFFQCIRSLPDCHSQQIISKRKFKSYLVDTIGHTTWNNSVCICTCVVSRIFFVIVNIQRINKVTEKSAEKQKPKENEDEIHDKMVIFYSKGINICTQKVQRMYFETNEKLLNEFSTLEGQVFNFTLKHLDNMLYAATT